MKLKYKEKLKEFISETADQILQKESDINDTRIDYHKKKSVINTRFGIILLVSMIILIVGLYDMNWSCIIVSFVIGVFSYLYVEEIKTKTLKTTTKKTRSLYKDLHKIQKNLTEAQDEGWLPSSHQIYGEVTSM